MTLNNNRLFSSLIPLKYLLNANDSWKENLADLQSTIGKYQSTIELEKIGFPENWGDILKN